MATTQNSWRIHSYLDNEVHDPYNFGLSDNLINLISALIAGLSIIFLIDLFFRLIVRSSRTHVTSFAIYRRWLFSRCTNPIEGISSLFTRNGLPSVIPSVHQLAGQRRSGAAVPVPRVAVSSPDDKNRDDEALHDLSYNAMDNLYQHDAENVEQERQNGHRQRRRAIRFPLWQRVCITAVGLFLIFMELVLIGAATNRSTAVHIDRNRVPSFDIRDPGRRLEIKLEWNPCIVYPIVSKPGFVSHATLFLCAYISEAQFNVPQPARFGEIVGRKVNFHGQHLFPREIVPTSTNSRMTQAKRNRESDSGKTKSIQSDRQIGSPATCPSGNETVGVAVSVHNEEIFFNIHTQGYRTISRHTTAIAIGNGTLYRSLIETNSSQVVPVMTSVFRRYGMRLCDNFTLSTIERRDWRQAFFLDISNSTKPPDLPESGSGSGRRPRKARIAGTWNIFILSILRGTLIPEGRARAFKVTGSPEIGPFLDALDEPLITLHRPWLSLAGGLGLLLGVLVLWTGVGCILGWGSGVDERIAWMYMFRSINSIRDFYAKPDEIVQLH